MAGVWCVQCNWRKNGYRYLCDQEIFYLHFFFDPGIPGNFLFIYSFLDECQELYSEFKAQSFEIPVIYKRSLSLNQKSTSQ